MTSRNSHPIKRSDDFSPSRLGVKDAPVHIEVKKPKRLAVYGGEKDSAASERRRSEGEDSKLLQSARSSHQRSRTAYAKTVPWVPAPAKTQRANRITWEADKAVLEIPCLDRQDTTSTDVAMDRHELEGRDTDVSLLGNDASPPPLGKSALRRSAMKESASIASAGEDSAADESLALEERKTAFSEGVTQKFEKELEDLRLTVSSLKAEAESSRREARSLGGERDELLRRVAQLESGGGVQARAEHLGRSLSSAGGIGGGGGGGGGDGGLQREALLVKLSEFEETNRLLRRLLDEQQQQQRSVRLEDASDGNQRRAALVDRLTSASEENGRLRLQLVELEKRTLDQRIQLEASHEEQLKQRSIQSSLEQTRAHLQRELRSREADCNRMAVQVRTLESRLAQEKVEVDHLQELLRQAHSKYDQDKDALKKAARLQRQRATETTGAVDQLSTKLAEKEQLLADAMLARDAQRNRAERLAADLAALSSENGELKKQLTDQELQRAAAEVTYQEKVGALKGEVHSKSSELAVQREEGERQAALAQALERRAASAEELVATLRVEVARLEAVCAETERALSKARQATSETSEQLAEQKQLVERVRADADAELDDVRQRLMARLGDLEPLPDTLRTAELRRSAAEERVHVLERQGAEAERVIVQLTDKGDVQARDIMSWKEKYQKLESALQERTVQLQSRLNEAEARCSELSAAAARRDEATSLAGQRAEQLIRDNAALAGQLDAALADARRAHEEARERSSLKEKSLSDRTRELDQQLASAKAEAAKARRERDEAERRLSSKLQDLKDRLEQSHSTNRSMQNYVQVLKNSYASIFGDVSVAAADVPIASSSPVAARSYTSTFQ